MSEPTRRRAAAFAVASLALALGCGAAGDSTPAVTNPPANVPVTPPTPGALVVVLQPHGNGRDADGFSAAIDGASPRALAYDSTVVFDALSPGDHIVRLDGIAPQCSASAASITRTVKSGVTDTVSVGMTCLGGFAYLELIDSTRYDIAYLTEDGRTIQLTSGPGLKFIESWSPDGTRLLYTTLQNNEDHIYSVRADGTDVRTVSSGPGNEYSPRWSPDGKHLAYIKGDATDGTIYVAISDPDGANVRPLVDKTSFDFDVAWSTDGSRLYFGCRRFQRIFVRCTAALDGSDLRPIRYAALDSIVAPCTPVCLANVMHFSTSADGRTIAIEVGPYRGDVLQRVWAGTLDGANAVPLSGNTLSFAGLWSPAGDRMLLNINDGGTRYALATVNRDGTGYRQITSYDDGFGGGNWSPDGTVIGYGDRAGQIGAMNADGSLRRRLTAGSPFKAAPVWNPKARVVGSLSGDRAHTSSPHLEQVPVLPRLRP